MAAGTTIEFICEDCDGDVISSFPNVAGIGICMPAIQSRVREIHQEKPGCASHCRISARNLPNNVEALVEVTPGGNSSSGKFPDQR